MQTLLVSLIILAVIVLVVSLTGIYVRHFTYRAVARIEKNMIDTEYILDSGTVPEDWTKKVTIKNTEFQSEATNQLLKNTAISRLKKLIKFHRSSMLPDNEETRKILLTRLAVVQKSWEQMTWDEMIK